MCIVSWVDAAGAIGTWAAVVVAVTLAGGPALLRWHRRPRLTLECRDEAPFVRSAIVESVGAEGHFLRVMARNDGKRTAHRVRGRIGRWSVRVLDGDSWTAQAIDPVAMHWVSMPMADAAGDPSPELDLAPGDWDFADLCMHLPPARRTELISHDQRKRGFGLNLDPGLAFAEQLVEVRVVAEDAEATSLFLRFKATSFPERFSVETLSQWPRWDGL